VTAACASNQRSIGLPTYTRQDASRHIQRIKSNAKLVLITVTDRNHSGTRLGHDRER
jgi:hypothetical protein